MNNSIKKILEKVNIKGYSESSDLTVNQIVISDTASTIFGVEVLEAFALYVQRGIKIENFN